MVKMRELVARHIINYDISTLPFMNIYIAVYDNLVVLNAVTPARLH